MSELLKKSENNLKSAITSLQNQYYPSGIHSAYYSCVQRMKHYLFYKLGFDEAKLELELKIMKASSLNTKAGLHVYLINYYGNKLMSDPSAHREFSNHIIQLRTLREKGDYKDVAVDYADCKNAIQFSKTVLSTLDSKFK